MSDLSVIVVTHNSLPHIERCLTSVGGDELIVVDHESTDGTVELIEKVVPNARLIREDNRGFGAGMNTGIRAATGRYLLLMNPDCWPVEDAVARLVAFAEQHPTAAVVGPRLINTDGTLQPSVRAFPTLWRLATQFLLLHKLAPNSRILNAAQGGGFDHRSVRDADWLLGACLLVRREAVLDVGLFDEDYFLFSEEVDLCFRLHQAGWKVLFCPFAAFVHVVGVTHDLHPVHYNEQLRGHLRFLAKHRGRRRAEQARWLLLVSMTLRGLLFRGERRRTYRAGAGWLSSGRVPHLLESKGTRLAHSGRRT